MNLQLPLGGHQMQRLLRFKRWQGVQTDTIQSPMIGTALRAGSMAGAQACGHLGRVRLCRHRFDPADFESSGERANHNPFDTIPGVSAPTGRLDVPMRSP